MNRNLKLGFMLLVAQVIMLGMTLGFNTLLDKQAQNDGIASIITEAGR